MRRRTKNKVRYRVCLFWGLLIAMIILFATDGYDNIGDFDIDNVDWTWHKLHTKIYDGAHHWLFVQWKWDSADSDAANAILGILHVTMIIVIIPLFGLMTVFIFAFGYVVPMCVGNTLGYIMAYAVDGYSKHHVSYNRYMLNTCYIAAYTAHTLLSGLALYVIFRWLNIRMDSFGFITEPLKIAAISIYDGITGKKEVEPMNRLPNKAEVILPQVFDEREIETGLLKYRSDKGLLNVYVSGLIDRFKDDAQIKVIKKKIERLSLGKEYLDKLYEAQQSYNKVATFGEVDAIERQKRQLERRKLDAESDRLDLMDQVKRKTLELRLAQIEAKRVELLQKDREVRKEDRDDIKATIQKIRDSVTTIEGIKQEIRNSHPAEEAERIIDEFERMLVEKGITGE